MVVAEETIASEHRQSPQATGGSESYRGRCDQEVLAAEVPLQPMKVRIYM